MQDMKMMQDMKTTDH